MSYIDFFEFNDHPFRITPDVEFYFTSDTHSQAYDSLKYFVDSDEGFFTLIGEPGSGKTITIRKFLNNIPEDVEYAYILFPSLKPEDMFRAVLEDLGYRIDSDMSKNALFAGFRDFLTEKKAQGKRILLIIDEAQNLPIDTLEELRILSNLETEKEKLIQFILAGQPELNEKLESTELRQLRQRITLHCDLQFLDPEEVEKYVVFRLSKAGYSGKYPEKPFYKKLIHLTKGNPRLINLTMERALMSAFLKQSKSLDTSDLHSAAESLRLERALTHKKKKNTLTYSLIAVIVLLVCALAVQMFAKQMAVTKERMLAKEKAKIEAQMEAEKQRAIKEKALQEEESAKAEEPEPQQEEIFKYGYSTTDNLNIRSAPTIDGDNVLAKLNKGTKVKVLSEAGDWRYISVADALYGWVYADYILIPE